jgi:putative mRNA 3-end processing factor
MECSLIIAPPSVIGSDWLNRLAPYSVGYASGWMLGGKGFRRNGIDKGFAISDHADWDALNLAVKQTGAENIYVTHGFTFNFVNWLRRIGYNAFELKELEASINRKTTPKQLTLFDL